MSLVTVGSRKGRLRGCGNVITEGPSPARIATLQLEAVGKDYRPPHPAAESCDELEGWPGDAACRCQPLSDLGPEAKATA